MKKLTIISTVAFAVISLASASAQVIPTAGLNDLILGFRATTAGSTGANTNLEFDLGAASNFTTSASFADLGLLGTDLSNTYGADWATRTDLVWSVAALVGTNVYDVTSNSVPTERSSYLNYIGGLAQTLNSPNAIPAVGAGAATVGNAATPAGNITGSYTTAVTGLGGGDFGLSSFTIGQSQAVADSSINLYRLVRASGTSTPASLLGSFTLSGSGTSADFSFNGSNVTTVPEPSTYALMIGGLALLVAFGVRRNLIA